jgi:predicted nucleic acid-binding protein
MKERVVIDTNILYALVDAYQTKDTKVTQLVIAKLKKYQLLVTSASVIEVIVKNKYLNNLDVIKKCLKPIIEKEYELIDIPYVPIKEEILNIIYKAERLEDVQNQIDDIINLKICREAELLNSILIIVISGIFDVLIENHNYKFDDNVKKKRQYLLIENLINERVEPHLSFFKKQLTKGYKYGKSANVAEDSFYFLLSTLIKSFFRDYHMINDSCFAKDSKCEKILETPFCIFKRNDSTIQKHLITIGNEIIDYEGMSELTTDALLFRLKHSYEEGAKIRKNDIFDWLIAFSLDTPNIKIVTVDRGFCNFLKNKHSDSYNLCDDLGFVKKPK